MNEFIIKNYISKLSTKDIKNFCTSHELNLTDDEIKIIEKEIKTNWKTIIYGNPNKIFNNIKNKLTIDNYNKIEKLYIEFKNKYQNYL